ncbi:MAG: TonB-dependent receptor [Acidobacteria bacterium]|nr:TonB-dependent receptor [Acidobacteriota bacterium]
MGTSRTASCVFVAFVVCFLFAPAAARAQVADSASIAGVVRDASGGVLPGVTVEAASPALIDKVRTAVSDGQGLFRIVDLRPGVYSVTFTLPGFSTLKRDGLELTTGFTANINAELRVGTVEETVTVTGESPVVDISNVRQQTTLERQTLDALPTTGRLAMYAQIIPGATYGSAVWQSVGGLDERGNQFGIHGSRSDDNAPVMDGIVQRLQGGAIFVFNNLTFQEVVVETGGLSAERGTGGVQMNIIPKDGGNTFSGSFSTSHSSPSLQASNLTDDLQARGLRFASSLKQHYDTGGAIGGPILRDKLWFYNAYRFGGNQQYQQGNYFNKLQGVNVSTDPVYKVTFYEPDLNRPGYTDDFYRDFSLRLTWQAASKHKIVASYQVQPNCSCFWPLLELGPQQGVQGTPEAVGAHNYKVNYLPLVSWTFPATDRMLFEAGASANVFDNNTLRTDASVGLDTIAITELSGNFRYGSRALGLTHAQGYRVQHNRQYRQRASMSYITGSHAFKVGGDFNEYSEGEPGKANDWNQINGARSYAFRDRIPQQVTIYAVPFEALWRARDMAAYAQDQWTVRKLTLNLGVRFNGFNGNAPATQMPEGPFVPARSFPAVHDSPNWFNLNPRLGAAYDLFGNGKTAVKVSLGRYSRYQPNINAVDPPANNQAPSTARTWTDGNRNYVPDCDLRNPVANGECGPWSNLNFGRVVGGNRRRAEDAREGLNGQEYSWQASAAVQHELSSNVALNVGYFRTWYGGLLATDNQAITAADYDPFCVTVPSDRRLPGGGGGQLCGLFDIKPTAFGRVDNVVTQSSNYGNQTEVYNGVDVTLQARFGTGGQVGGGVSTGRTISDTCALNALPQVGVNTLFGVDVAATAPIVPRTSEFCRGERPATQFKMLVVYPLPWDFQVSATYQNIPGIPVTASRVFTNAEIRPSLGRDLGQCRGAATCTANAVIEMIPTGAQFEDRLQQIDLRVTRSFRVAQARIRGNADFYNLLNAGDVLNMTTRYAGATGGQWLQPIQILGGRMFKFSAQLDF